jgi:hypothetical protein
MPNFGGGRPPKLGPDQRKRLLKLLRVGQPWKNQEIQHRINETFDVECHPVHPTKFLEKPGLSSAILRTKRPSRPEDAEESLDERVGDAFDEGSDEPHNKREGDDEEGWVVDEEIRTDGGTVLGFLDTSHPQPWDNSQRLYTVDDPHITRPLVT